MGETKTCFCIPPESGAIVERLHFNRQASTINSMNERKREYFDRQVEWVLAQLPQGILRILEDVPLHVEDRPSKQLMQQLRLALKLGADGAGKLRSGKLCSYLSGVPYGKTSQYFGLHAYLPAKIPEPHSVTIFRRGIVVASRDEEGKVCRDRIRQQIRSSILCSLARLHGMKEEEIADRYG